MARQKEFRLTGRHVLAMFIAFFGLIFAVNFYMAWLANKSWTGLLPGNGYEASIKFNAEAAKVRAMLAKGWRTKLTHDRSGRIVIELTDAKGRPVTGLKVTGVIGRPVQNRDDRKLVFTERKIGLYEATTPLKVGVWHLDAWFRRGEELQWRLSERFVIRPD